MARSLPDGATRERKGNPLEDTDSDLSYCGCDQEEKKMITEYPDIFPTSIPCHPATTCLL